MPYCVKNYEKYCGPNFRYIAIVYFFIKERFEIENISAIFYLAE